MALGYTLGKSILHSSPPNAVQIELPLLLISLRFRYTHMSSRMIGPIGVCTTVTSDNNSFSCMVGVGVIISYLFLNSEVGGRARFTSGRG